MQRCLVVAIVLAACSNASSFTDARPVDAASPALTARLAPPGSACSPHALVTFVIDDGALADYTVKKPIFDVHRAVAVAAIISTRRSLSDDQLREMEAAGWEIANHSRTHPDLATLPGSEVENEVAGAQADLAARGFKVNVFVYPYGRSNALVHGIASRYHRATVRVGGGLNHWQRGAGVDLGRYNFGTQYARPGQNTLTFYESKVDSAGKNSEWLIYMVHQLLGADAQNLGDLLDYIHAQGIPIVTVTEGLRLLWPCQVRGRAGAGSDRSS